MNCCAESNWKIIEGAYCGVCNWNKPCRFGEQSVFCIPDKKCMTDFFFSIVRIVSSVVTVNQTVFLTKRGMTDFGQHCQDCEFSGDCKPECIVMPFVICICYQLSKRSYC